MAIKFDHLMELFGDDFYDVTVCKLSIAITKKVVNSKYMSDIEKACLLDQYYKNLITNKFVMDRIEEYKNRF